MSGLSDRGATPWHLWLVGVVTLLWNCGGVYDYLMSVTRNAAYMAQMTPEQAAFMTAVPIWSTTAFAVSVWTSLAGSVLLLMRRRWAVWAFALSLAAFLANMVYYFVLSDGMSVMGTVGAVFTVVLFAVMLFELWYSRRMAKRGVLR